MMDRTFVDALSVLGFDRPSFIGQGPHGSVYRAREISSERMCAVKVLDHKFASGSERRSFERELRERTELASHVSINDVYRTGYLKDGRPFVVSAYQANGSLADRLRTAGPLPVRSATEIAVALATALSAGHRSGIFHGNLKLQNVLLTADNNVLLSDFDVPSMIGEEDASAHTAVEVLQGASASAESDQWALASTVYEMITGAPPFPRRPRETVTAWTVRVLEGEPVPILRPDVPASLRAALARALSKAPEQRWSSVDAFANELRAVQAEQGWPVTPAFATAEAEVELAVPKPEGALPHTVTRARTLQRPTLDTPVVRKKRRVPAIAGAAATVFAVIGAIALVAGNPGTSTSVEVPTPTTSWLSTTTTTPPATTPPTTTPSTSTMATAFAPTKVRILDDTGDTISLGWKNEAGVSAFVVDITQAGANARPVERTQQVDSTVISGLTPGVPYCIAVGAVYAFGERPAYAEPVCRKSN